MIRADIIVVSVLFAIASAITLGWMIWNLIKLRRREAISLKPAHWLKQSREVLLKPFIFFNIIGVVLVGYMLARQNWVTP